MLSYLLDFVVRLRQLLHQGNSLTRAPYLTLYKSMHFHHARVVICHRYFSGQFSLINLQVLGVVGACPYHIRLGTASPIYTSEPVLA